MCYISGKSSNKIVHNSVCRYVKMMPDKNKRFFHTLKEASEAGYKQCKYCAHIKKYLRREEKELDRYCKPKGGYYFFNPEDGSLEVLSKSGKWKVIVNGQKHFIWLYHRNNGETNLGGLVPGFHSQKVRCGTLMGYMEYIVKHDEYRNADPLYENQKHENTVIGSKKWRKDRRREKKIRRMQSIRYVDELLSNMSLGNIPY